MEFVVDRKDSFYILLKAFNDRKGRRSDVPCGGPIKIELLRTFDVCLLRSCRTCVQSMQTVYIGQDALCHSALGRIFSRDIERILLLLYCYYIAN